MRYLVGFVIFLVIFFATIYGVAFTTMGNNFVKPMIESQISKEIGMQSRLATFALSTKEIEAVLELNEGNSVKIRGSYSLFSQNFNLLYEVNFKHLESLELLTKMVLRGAFYTNGTLSGDLAFMKIEGKTDFAEGKTLYFAELQEFKPTSLIANMKNAKLASLLYSVGKNPYAWADIDLDINLTKLTPHAMEGDVKLKSKNATINPQLMKSDFNLTVVKTPFSVDLNAKLQGENIDYSCNLSSNLFNINSSGKATLEPLRLNAAYVLDIQNLEALKIITNLDMRGSLKLDGTLKGDKEAMVLHAKSDLASSNTTLEALLKDFKPISLHVKTKDLRLGELLYMLKQPKFVEADLSANLNYDLPENRGKIISLIENAKFMQNQTFDLVKQFAKFDLYKELFRGTSNTLLSGDRIITSLELVSQEAVIKSEEAKINIKQNSIDADVMLRLRKDELHARLSGDIDSPKVTIDFDRFMKTQSGQEVIERLFQKLLK